MSSDAAFKKKLYACTNPLLEGPSHLELEARELFRTLDTDGDEFASANEVAHMFNLLGMKELGPEPIDIFMRAVDMDGDGRVSMRDFTGSLTRQIEGKMLTSVLPGVDMSIANVTEALRFVAKDAGFEPSSVPAAALQKVIAAFTPIVEFKRDRVAEIARPSGRHLRRGKAAATAAKNGYPEPPYHVTELARTVAEAADARAWALLRAQSATSNIDVNLLARLLLDPKSAGEQSRY